MASTSTLGSLAILNVKSFTIKSSKNRSPCRPTLKAAPRLSHKYLPISFTSFKSMVNAETFSLQSRITGAILSTLIACDPALSAPGVADAVEGDNRALALLLPIIPAILWVLYNILGPALNQINRMQTEKGVASRKRK